MHPCDAGKAAVNVSIRASLASPEKFIFIVIILIVFIQKADTRQDPGESAAFPTQTAFIEILLWFLFKLIETQQSQFVRKYLLVFGSRLTGSSSCCTLQTE